MKRLLSILALSCLMCPALSLSLTVDFGTTTTESSFVLNNDKDSTINWYVNPDLLPAWLTMSPTSGDILPRGYSVISLRVDRRGLGPGTYSYDIIAYSGTQWGMTWIVTVKITVASTQPPILPEPPVSSGNNIALNRPASVSSTYPAWGFSSDKITNGTPAYPNPYESSHSIDDVVNVIKDDAMSNFIFSDGDPNQVATIDLGQIWIIGQIRFCSIPEEILRKPSKLVIDISNDNKNWVNIVNAEAPTETWTVYAVYKDFKPCQARWVRLNLGNADGPGDRICEVEISPLNIALNMPVIVSSTYPGFSADRITNGKPIYPNDPGNDYEHNFIFKDSDSSQVATIDLGRTWTIGQVRLCSSPWEVLRKPSKVVIDVSTDNKSWTNIVNAGAPMGIWTIYRDFGSHQARWVRISLGPANGAGDRICEVEVLPPGIEILPAPVITSEPLVSNVTPSSAMISWTTDKTSSSIIEYDTTGEYGLKVESANNVANHSVFLNSLSPDTLYYFRAGSANAIDNTTWSEQKTFKTLAIEMTPLVSTYEENFDDGEADKWQAVSGNWKVENGEYVQLEASGQSGVTLNRAAGYAIGDPTWTDYTFEVRIKPISTSNYAGVMFRVGRLEPDIEGNTLNSKSQYYYWLIGIGISTHGNYSHIWRTPENPGEVKPLEITPGDTLKSGEWNKVKVEMCGQNVKLYLNDKLQKDFNFPNDLQIKSGGIALSTSNASAAFDDVKVRVGGRTLSITSIEAAPGTNANIQLSITDATGIASGDVVIKYDASILTIGEVKGTDLLSDISLVVNKDIPNELRLSMAGTNGISSGSGTLVNIGLAIDLQAEIGTETKLEFVNAEIYDQSGMIIPANLENGTVKIKQSGIKGDVNNDGEVRSNDATLALRIAAGLLVPNDYQEWAADMNGDGRVRSNDATLILRKATGLAAPGKGIIAGGGRQITVALAGAHGIAGQSITVPLKANNVDMLGSGDVWIGYDPEVLCAVDVSSGSDMLLASNITEPGMVRISFAAPDRLDSVTLAEIRFNILADNASLLTLKSVELYNPDAVPIDSGKLDGKFTSWAIPPEHSALLQNFPNPFNPDTWIPYQLKEGGEVTIQIFSVPGDMVRELKLGYKPAGFYVSRDRAAYWDGRNQHGEKVASGIYFYSIQAGDYQATRKMIVAQ